MTTSNSLLSEKTIAIGLARVLLAILGILFLFAVWLIWPAILAVLQSPAPGIPPPQPEPVYMDGNGRRISEHDYYLAQGYVFAKTNKTVTHADCNALSHPYQAKGCHNYVTEQKRIPPHIPQRDFGNGKSTAQCRIEVNSHYKALIEDANEQGDHSATSVWARKRWFPELEECENYDRLRIGKVIHEPASRLDDLLKKIAQGGVVSEAEKNRVIKDLSKAMDYPDCAKKQAYIQKIEQFFRVVDHSPLPQ